MQFTITVTDVDGHSTTTLRTAQQIERDAHAAIVEEIAGVGLACLLGGIDIGERTGGIPKLQLRGSAGAHHMGAAQCLFRQEFPAL